MLGMATSDDLRDAQQVGGAGCAERHAGSDDEGLPGLRELQRLIQGYLVVELIHLFLQQKGLKNLE